MAPPVYDFISDSYTASKPYKLSVVPRKSTPAKAKKSANDEMVDLIGYLGGETPKQQTRAVKLTSQDARVDFSKQPKATQQQFELKLVGDKPGKILDDQKAALFLERVEHYVRDPSELVY